MFNGPRKNIWLLGLILASAQTLHAHHAYAQTDLFTDQVAPLLSSRCVRCHSGDEPAGELSLTTPNGLLDLGYLVPGRPEESLLLDVVTIAEGAIKPAMPKDATPLSEEDVAALRDWIAAGAPWPDGQVL